MLKKRVISAAILIPVAALLLYLGGWWFTTLVLLFGVLAGYEAYTMLGKNGHMPLTWWGILFIAVLILTGMVDPGGRWFFIILTAGLLLTLTRALFHATKNPATDWALTVAVALYLGVLMRHGPLLRNLEHGLEWVLMALLVTWVADSGAYFIGTAIGRHPLAPRLSPKKTWEGAVGGWVVGVLVALIVGPWLLPITYPQAFVLGALISAISPPGDLAESMFKRQCGVKDSGHLIPGHGGAFDRIDSLLFVFPLVYWLALLWG